MGLTITPGYVGSDLILDGTIVNADVSASAAIELSKLATSTSSQLASIISDETGTDKLVFNTSPSFATDIRTPKVTTSGATNLVLDTNTGTTTGSITINTGANGNIAITPNGTGVLVVENTLGRNFVSSGFLSSPYQLVAPRGRVYQGTGALSTLTAAIATGDTPRTIVVDPTGRFAYVTNWSAGTVSQFAINQSTGALSIITTAISAGGFNTGAVVDPSGRFLYVTGDGGTIGQYSINQTTGALTVVGSAVSAGSLPQKIAIDPTGRFIYVANTQSSGTVTGFSINQSTGVLTSIGAAVAAGNNPIGITVDPTGRFVYVNNWGSATISQYSINQTTGVLTSIAAAVPGPNTGRTVLVEPSGRFAYSTGDNKIYQYIINQSTGALTSNGTLTFNLAGGITADPTGKFIYVSGTAVTNTFSINQSTGSLTQTSTIASPTAEFVQIDPTGRFIYVSDSGNDLLYQYSINNFSAGSVNISGRLGINNTAIIAGIDSVAGWAYDSTLASITNPNDIFFKSDGLRMYITTSTVITQYDLSVAWDITTAVAGSTFSMSPIDAVTLGLFISPDGTKMITCGSTGVVIANGSGVAGEDRAYYFTLGTPWDVSTATLVSSIRFALGDAGGIPAAITAPQAVHFNNDGTIMYIQDSTTDAVHQFALSTAYNVGTATWSKQFSVSGQETGGTGLRFNSAGTRMYVYGSTGDDVNEYRLSTAWDIATAVFYNRLYIGWYEITPTGLYINEAANVAFTCGSGSDAVLKFRTDRQGIELDPETATSKIELAGSTRVTDNFYVNGRAFIEGSSNVLGSWTIGNDLAVASNTTLTGDLAVNGGDLTTSAATFNLVNTTATTVNFAGAGTTISIGATTGTATINNPTVVVGNSTTSTLKALDATGIDTAAPILTIQGGANTGNNTAGGYIAFKTPTQGSTGSVVQTLTERMRLELSGSATQLDLTTTMSTVNVFNNSAGAMNFAGAATTISIGAATGTTTINNNLSVGNTAVSGLLTTGSATSNLVLSTNGGTTSSTITITAGANGNITFAPNGTGVVDLGAVTAVKITGGSNGQVLTTNGSGVLSWSPVTSGSGTVNSGTANQIAYYATNGTAVSGLSSLTWASNTLTVGALATATSISTNGAANLTISTNSGTNSGTILINNGVNGNIAITPNGTGAVNLGNIAASGTLTTGAAAANLVLSTNSGTNSGSITIFAGVNGNISITPNGTGVVDLGAVTSVRIAGGANTNLLSTNGSGVLSWVAAPTFTQVYPASGIPNSTGSAWGTSYSTTGSGTVVALQTQPSFTTDIRTPKVTTSGATNLFLDTNAGTNSGTIVINQGVNGAISIAPNGTGSTLVGGNSSNYFTLTGAASGTGPTVATAGATDANVNFNVQTKGTGSFVVASTTTNTTSNITASGANANINLVLAGKGTGSVVIGSLSGLLKGTSGVVSVATAGTDYVTPFGSQTQNFVYAAPNGSAGTPTFRALVANDIPATLNSTTIAGNLTVNGTTTTINSNTVSVDDKNLELGGITSVSPNGAVTAGSAVVTNLTATANIIPGSSVTALTGAGTVTLPANTIVASIDSATQITLNQVLTGSGASPTATLSISGATDTTANGGGITLLGATNKTIIWDSANSNWTSSEHWNIATSKSFKINTVTVLDTSQVLASATGVTVGGTSTTTVALGTNSTTLSTTTVGGAITGNILRINSAAAGTATFTTNNASNLVINTNSGTSTGNITVNTGLNADIAVTPNGTGNVRLGDTTASGIITTGAATANLTLSTNNGTTSGTIVITAGTNGNIAITPNGTGNVNLGDITAAGLVTTGSATANLTLNTNGGTSSGSIVITAGVNGNITVTPNGTGVIDLGAVTAVKITGGALGNVLTTNGSGVLSWGAAPSSMVYPASGIANSTGSAWGTSYSTTGSGTVVALQTQPSFTTDIRTPKVTTASAVNLVLDTNAGTTTGSITINTGANGDIDIVPNGSGFVDLGDITAAGLLTTGSATANLVLNTNNGTTSGSITIVAGAAGNITIAPEGTGDINLDADTVRVGDVNAAATITSNGSGALTVTTGGAANLVLSTNSGTNSGTITVTQGVNANIVLLPNGTGSVLVGSTSAGILNIQGTATSGTATLTTNVTTGIVNAFTGITTGTLNLATGGASTTNIGGTAAAVNIGTTSGNSILTIRGNATTGTATIITNTGVTTAAVFNTFATTGNLFGAATGINLGINAAALSTLTFGPAITGNIFKIGSTAAGTINLTSDVTTGIVNAYTGITTGTLNLATGGASTTNIGGAAAAVNIGTTAGNSTLTIRGSGAAGTAALATNVTTGIVNAFTSLTTGTVNVGSADAGRVAIAFNQASTSTTTGALTVAGGVGISGALNATTKSFIIPHPTKPGKLLRHGSLEGPEFGVYVRGKLTNSRIIELPEYWPGLVDTDSITVDLTPIGKFQKLYVEKIENNKIYIDNDSVFGGNVNCFYTVWATRRDVAALEVEGDE